MRTWGRRTRDGSTVYIERDVHWLMMRGGRTHCRRRHAGLDGARIGIMQFHDGHLPNAPAHAALCGELNTA